MLMPKVPYFTMAKGQLPKRQIMWTQDGALTHIAKKVQKFYKDRFLDGRFLTLLKVRPEHAV